MKADWRIGKVETVKFGRDDKVRELNVAYKIIKEDHWTHNVVTRPVRQILKLFEIGDTTFAEDMKAVHRAAKEILLQKGALDETSQKIDDWPGVDSPDNHDTADANQPKNLKETDNTTGTQTNFEGQDLNVAAASNSTTRHQCTESPSNFFDNGDLCLSDFRNHQPFLSCLSAAEWLQAEAEAVSEDETMPGCGVGDVLHE